MGRENLITAAHSTISGYRCKCFYGRGQTALMRYILPSGRRDALRERFFFHLPHPQDGPLSQRFHPPHLGMYPTREPHSHIKVLSVHRRLRLEGAGAEFNGDLSRLVARSVIAVITQPVEVVFNLQD